MNEPRRHSPAALRNAEPLAHALAAALPVAGTVLEIASGSGEHAVFLARRFPHLRWQPSDVDAEALASIAAHGHDGSLGNLAPPIRLDVTDAHWADHAHPGHVSAILVVNMLHISPWAATLGLFAGAEKLLRRESGLFIYGPFFQADTPIAPSNREFDKSLRESNAQWGVRALEEVLEAARQHGFLLEKLTSMPANNLTVQLLQHGRQ